MLIEVLSRSDVIRIMNRIAREAFGVDSGKVFKRMDRGDNRETLAESMLKMYREMLRYSRSVKPTKGVVRMASKKMLNERVVKFLSSKSRTVSDVAVKFKLNNRLARRLIQDVGAVPVRFRLTGAPGRPALEYAIGNAVGW